jgi:hypothetical protein
LWQRFLWFGGGVVNDDDQTDYLCTQLNTGLIRKKSIAKRKIIYCAPLSRSAILSSRHCGHVHLVNCARQLNICLGSCRADFQIVNLANCVQIYLPNCFQAENE